MKPNFALSLSFEGLKLLHRAPDGWSRVGEVPLDSPDLSGELARLRERALSLAPEGMRTKLLIPDDQIRYLALEGTLDDAQVAAALEGTTPYAVEELVIDHLARDGRTHVAAVARETLDEAEGFAREHALGPVAFAATPAPDGFPGEPWFGAVPGLDAPVAPDDTPVQERQDETPDPAPVEETPPETTPVPETTPPFDPAPVPDPAPISDPTPEATVPPAAPDAPDAPDAGDDSPVPAPDAPASPADPSPAMAETPQAPATEATPRVTETDPMGDADEDLLDTPAEPERADPLPQAGAPVMPDLPHPAENDEARPRPASQTGARPAPPPLHPPLPPQGADSSEAEPGLEAEADAVQTARQIMPPAMPRPGAPPAVMPAVPPAQADAPEEAEPQDAEAAALAAGAALSAPAGAVPAAPPAPATPKARTTTPRLDRASERERMTVFGARGAESARRTGRLGWIGAAVALVLLAVLASLWLGASEQEPQAGLVRDASPAASLPVDEAQVGAEAEAEAEMQLAAAAPLPDYTDFPPPAPAAGAAVSPAEAERIYAATGVWLRAPRLPLTPRAEPVGTPVSASVAPVPMRNAAPGPRLAVAVPDGGLPLQPDPPGPGRVFERDERGFIAATAEGTVTPQGLTVYAGPPTVIPPTRPGTEAPPAAEPESETETEAETGEEITIVIPELPARPEPDGLDLRLGSPPVVPPTRPGTDPPGPGAADTAETSEEPQEAAVQISPGGVSLDGLRPAGRPADAAPEAELPELAAFEGPRPPARPEGLVPDPQGQLDDAARAQAEALAQAVGEAPEAPPARASVSDALASLMADAPDPLANATPQAVATARRPDTRPRNFDRVVAQSRARSTPAAAASGRAAQPASNATVAPDGPVPGGVARAATQENAIDLHDINLIGVYGKPGARRALVRLGNGRYLRVGIGDTLDGGRVSAIGDDVLNYVKRGRTQVLKIPD
ncbi:hypothetical protein [Limimaricola cinnabarinus]|uniref:hypothetical protein n=1 Tax=Limimaricola cinnabarinus TaxID=1125964 RepID=UPI00249044D7|nr:hypothetical protein [Limimaricola cinnabarinus]